MDDTTVEIKQAELEKAIHLFIDQVIQACNKLTSDKRRVCLVLDGVEPFKLKRLTHVKRNALSNEHLNVANRLLKKKGDHTGAINKHAAAHVRFTSETKNLIAKVGIVLYIWRDVDLKVVLKLDCSIDSSSKKRCWPVLLIHWHQSYATNHLLLFVKRSWFPSCIPGIALGTKSSHHIPWQWSLHLWWSKWHLGKYWWYEILMMMC